MQFRELMIGVLCGFCCLAETPIAANEARPAPGVIAARPLERLPPGIDVMDEKTRGFSNLLLFVKGKLTQGDVAKVNSLVKSNADLFNIVYAANVAKNDQGRFRLERVSVGFSTKIKGKDIIVTSETANGLGASLGLISGSVLSGNEKALEEITLLAHNDTMAVIEAPSMMFFQGKHQKMPVRFFIWADPETGKVGMTSWLLQNQAGKLVFAEQKFNYVATPLVENREMHVDGNEFTLGIPSQKAFAMMSIPPGKEYGLTAEVSQTATQSQFTPESLVNLAKGLSTAMR